MKFNENKSFAKAYNKVTGLDSSPVTILTPKIDFKNIKLSCRRTMDFNIKDALNTYYVTAVDCPIIMPIDAAVIARADG